MRGGPGTSDPARITYENVMMLRLLERGFGVDFNKVSGPSWLDSLQYTIIANVPAGTTKEQLPMMWQHLLKERFHLTVHHETRDFPAYELVVAKGGPKLQPSAGDPGKPPQPGLRWTVGADGFPVLPPGGRHGLTMANENGVQVTRETFRYYTMPELCQQLAWPLGEFPWQHVASVGHIVDKTGLAGRYDFRLEYTGTHAPGGAFLKPGELGAAPDLFGAVQRQLGLQIKTSKAPADVLVVDHIDKMPTAN
jgi:uncharacterized protein (TIGR03435 family)